MPALRYAEYLRCPCLRHMLSVTYALEVRSRAATHEGVCVHWHLNGD